jgi:hypothetical protein
MTAQDGESGFQRHCLHAMTIASLNAVRGAERIEDGSSVASTTARKRASIAGCCSLRTVTKCVRRAASCGMRWTVGKAIARSPLPCPMCVPVRANPSGIRRVNRPNWHATSGASIAIKTITDPCSHLSDGGAMVSCGGWPSRSNSRPAGMPAMSKSPRRPKFARTRTPSV